jgi:hypothetical protein
VRQALAGLVAAVCLLAAAPARADTVDHHRRDRCRYEDCGGDRYGDGGSGGGQGASGGDYEGGKSGDDDQRGDHNCRNFCFYGIPAPGDQPKGFIPPNPSKIPQQIADFIKVVSDFVQAVVRFAV